jgi:hypothetical protein
MAERDVVPESDGAPVAGGSDVSSNRTGAPTEAVPRPSSPLDSPIDAASSLEALTGPSPMRVIRQTGQQTAALRRELAEKAAATDELREALHELRQVLDVDNPPQRGGSGRRPSRWLLIAALGLAAIGLVIYMLRDSGSTAVPSVASASPSAGSASAPSATVSPGTAAGKPAASTTGPAVQPSANASVSPLPWPGGAVLVPPGLTTTGTGATTPGTDVQVALDPDKMHLDVFERLLLDTATADPVSLASTSLPGGVDAAVSDLQVQLDDQVASATSTGTTSWDVASPAGRTYTKVTLRYRLSKGALQSVADSVPGRVSAVVPPLTAGLSQAHNHPVQIRALGAQVIQVTCPAADIGAVCGTRTSDGWTAIMPADSQRPIFLVSINGAA